MAIRMHGFGLFTFILVIVLCGLVPQRHGLPQRCQRLLRLALLIQQAGQHLPGLRAGGVRLLGLQERQDCKADGSCAALLTTRMLDASQASQGPGPGLLGCQGAC